MAGKGGRGFARNAGGGEGGGRTGGEITSLAIGDAVLSQSDCDVDTDDPSNFSTIISRTQRRKRQQQERDRSIQLSAPIPAFSATGGRAPSLSGAKSRPLIFGHSITAALKASKTLYVKKSVYCIGNVDAMYTADILRDYIESCGVRVTSCFDRTSINARINDKKTFRVCILDMDREKLLSPDNWAVGISIQKWIFKPKENIDEEERDICDHCSWLSRTIRGLHKNVVRSTL